VHRLTPASTVVAVLAVAVAVLAGGAALASSAALLPVGVGALGPSPAMAQMGPPSSEPVQDLRADKLDGPRYEDSTPGRAAGLPMAAAGVAAFAVVLVLVVRSRRRRRPVATTAAPPPG
jgi:hypothetical protein